MFSENSRYCELWRKTKIIFVSSQIGFSPKDEKATLEITQLSTIYDHLI